MTIKMFQICNSAMARVRNIQNMPNCSQICVAYPLRNHGTTGECLMWTDKGIIIWEFNDLLWKITNRNKFGNFMGLLNSQRVILHLNSSSSFAQVLLVHHLQIPWNTIHILNFNLRNAMQIPSETETLYSWFPEYLILYFMNTMIRTYVLLVKIEGPVWFILYLFSGVVSNPSIQPTNGKRTSMTVISHTRWCPPVTSWFINPSNCRYLRTINHSYWSYWHQISYRLGAPHCMTIISR